MKIKAYHLSIKKEYIGYRFYKYNFQDGGYVYWIEKGGSKNCETHFISFYPYASFSIARRELKIKLKADIKYQKRKYKASKSLYKKDMEWVKKALNRKEVDSKYNGYKDVKDE